MFGIIKRSTGERSGDSARSSPQDQTGKPAQPTLLRPRAGWLEGNRVCVRLRGAAGVRQVIMPGGGIDAQVQTAVEHLVFQVGRLSLRQIAVVGLRKR
jgi:hypothetical protein